MQQYTWGPSVSNDPGAGAKTIAQHVFYKLRGDIICGRIEPGKKLQIDPLKAQYGAGSSPVREALTQLAAIGLVNAEGQKGFRVVQVSLKELADITSLRLLLEVRGLRQSIRHGDVEWEINVSAAYRRLTHAIDSLTAGTTEVADNWEVVHRAFHMTLMSACGSPWMLSFCDRLYDQFQRYRRIFVTYQHISGNILADHKKLHDLALKRDEDAAAKLLENHILKAARATDKDARAQGIRKGDEDSDSLDAILSTFEGTPPPKRGKH